MTEEMSAYGTPEKIPLKSSQNQALNFPVCLAPMVGLSHIAFRLICRSYLPKGAHTIWPTEMLSSRRLPHEKVGFTPETLRAQDETHLVPQILGNEEKPIAESVRKLVDWGAEGIDINMGCPVRKALQHNYGVALMGDPEYAWQVVRVTVRNSSVPVSVKLRAGGEGEMGFLKTFVRGIEDAGASWIAFHPRTTEQKRRGNADWQQIRELRESLSIPVIGNGDVQIAQDVFDLLKQTGCASAMVGRALTARPWLLWQVGERLGFSAPFGRERERAPATPLEEGAEYGRMLLRMLDLCEHYFGEDLGMRKFRFFVRTGSAWLDFGNQLYGIVTKAKTYDECRVALAQFFASEHRMSQKTELRQ